MSVVDKFTYSFVDERSNSTSNEQPFTICGEYSKFQRCTKLSNNNFYYSGVSYTRKQDYVSYWIWIGISYLTIIPLFLNALFIGPYFLLRGVIRYFDNTITFYYSDRINGKYKFGTRPIYYKTIDTKVVRNIDYLRNVSKFICDNNSDKYNIIDKKEDEKLDTKSFIEKYITINRKNGIHDIIIAVIMLLPWVLWLLANANK